MGRAFFFAGSRGGPGAGRPWVFLSRVRAPVFARACAQVFVVFLVLDFRVQYHAGGKRFVGMTIPSLVPFVYYLSHFQAKKLVTIATACKCEGEGEGEGDGDGDGDGGGARGGIPRPPTTQYAIAQNSQIQQVPAGPNLLPPGPNV